MRIYRPRTAESRILNRLRETEGAYCTTGELIAAVWGGMPGGGPTMAAQAVRVYVSRLRALGYPIHHTASRGYRFIPTHWEIAEMNDPVDHLHEQTPHGRTITRGRKKLATDYLPPIESVRLKRTIERTEAQRNTAMTALAICEGQLAAKDFEIDALKRVIKELTDQRDAAWAKPANMVPDEGAATNLAGSQTVVPG